MIDLPPRTSQEIREIKLARIQAQIASQAEQLRILLELVEALRGEVDAMRQDAATRTQSAQDAL